MVPRGDKGKSKGQALGGGLILVGGISTIKLEHMFLNEEGIPSQQTTKTAANPGESLQPGGFRLGDRVQARQDWDRSMSPLAAALEGPVVYLDPKGYWLTIQGPRYRESFSVSELSGAAPGQGSKTSRASAPAAPPAVSGEGHWGRHAPRGPYNRARRIPV